jgi:hypothetical protein
MSPPQFLHRCFLPALFCALLAGPARAGTLFVACDGANNVQVLPTAGPAGTPIPGGSLVKPLAIAIDQSGILYVSNDHSPYFIEKYSATGMDLGTFTAATSLNRPYGLAFDIAGNLYVANFGNNTIEEFSSAGADIGPFVSSGLSGPIGLAFDSSGDLYVVNSGANTIGEFSATGANLATVTSSNLSFPFRLAFDAAGNFYVTSHSTNSIVKFSAAGGDMGAFATTNLAGPTGVAFDSDGNLYACSENSPNIEKYSSTGTDLGALGSVAGTSASPTDIAFLAGPGGQVEFSAATYQTFEDAGNITVTVERLGGTNGATSVNYNTTNVTAAAGTDYTATNGTLSWEDGDGTAKTFQVPILDGGIMTGASVKFSVTFLRVTGTAAIGSPAQATVTITDNDVSPGGHLAFTDSADQVSEDEGSVTITVGRTGGSNGATSVTYATASNGNAVAGKDYTASSGTLSWADGDATDKPFQVPILDRGITGGASVDFDVNLGPVTGHATLGTSTQATVTIVDNDTPSQPTISLTAPANNAFVAAGKPVTLSATVSDPANQLSQVQFLVGGTVIATLPKSGSVYSQSFTFGTTGTAQIEAVATSLQGGKSASSVTVTVGTEPIAILDNPPEPVTILAGIYYVQAHVYDPSHQLSTVQFLAEGEAGPGDDEGNEYEDPVIFEDEGTYVVHFQAIALDGSVSDSQQTITVVDTTGAVTAPLASFLTALEGLTVPGGGRLVVTVMASSGANGQALKTVDFYADGVLFASDDGSGHPILHDAPGRQPVTLDAAPVTSDAAPASVNTVFHATYPIPATTQPVSIVAIATTVAGISQTTKPAHVQPVAESGTQPVVTVGNVTGSEPVGAGARRKVPVTVSASSTAIAKLKYYVNGKLVSTATAPPYSFEVTTPTVGVYVLTAIATDAKGVSTVSAPRTIQVVPTVSLSVTGDGKAIVGGEDGKVLFKRTGGGLSEPLTVYFNLTGQAVDGVNYSHVGKKVVIPAGKAAYTLKIKPIDTMTGPLSRKLDIKLLPAPNGSYATGAVVRAKLTVEQTN